ncbi:MAG: hypothetical protein K8T20_18240 [Planctomycetes bacterium]|nr:hypothetical protein [Planctomycetota bacterium]
MKIQFANPAQVTLLGYIFASLLRRGLADAGVAKKVAGLGRIGIEMAGLSLTADFGDSAVTLSNGRDGCRAWVGGGMEALIGVGLSGAFLGPWLGGRLQWGGNPFALLKLLAVLAAARKAG